MKTISASRKLVFVTIALLPVFSVSAAPLSGVSQAWSGVGNAPNVNPPQIESTLFGEEVFAYVDRTAELTSVRYDGITGLLTNLNTGVLANLPAYLLGAQYVANANANRTAGAANDPGSYIVTYTLSSPAWAYLLLDNRLNGTASHATSSTAWTDPDLGGSLAWVLNDGWRRINTGFMPNGQGDYVGIDEGATVSGPLLRTHTSSGLVAGAGEGLNNAFAVYAKYVNAASFVTRGIRQTTGNGNMYVVAVVPEPATWTFLTTGGLLLLVANRRK